MATPPALQHLIQTLNQRTSPFQLNNEASYTEILKKIGDSQFVLLGEATHGTTEFYLSRIEITKRLITEKGFNAVVIEGDWTSTYTLHRFVSGYSNKTAEQAIQVFKRFPAWMWNNATMPEFLIWLRHHNDRLEHHHKIGFYGMDLYCINEAMQSVISYLEKVDVDAAKIARERYACFDHVTIDPQLYGYQVESGARKACADEVKQQFIAMQNLMMDKFHNEFEQHGDNLFYAMLNALVVKNAEKYYRALFDARDVTWNLRDQHMMQVVRCIKQHLEDKFKKPAKMVIWAHNSHVGDARATEMAERGEWNLGQLMRESYSDECYLVGFSTALGKVTAANNWGAKAQSMLINPPIASSYEALFHAVESKNFLLDLNLPEFQDLLKPARLQRAIGVVYRPDSERMSHYFFTKLLQQFNAVIHFDKTSALIPLPSEAATAVS